MCIRDSHTTLTNRFAEAASFLPLVAILRGIQPSEVVSLGSSLYEVGFRLIEVPLNSPEPFASIAALRRALPEDALVGAGTVSYTHLDVYKRQS